MGTVNCWHPGADCMCRDGEVCLTASGEYGVLFSCGIDFQEEKNKLKKQDNLREAGLNNQAFRKSYEKIEAIARGQLCRTV